MVGRFLVAASDGSEGSPGQSDRPKSGRAGAGLPEPVHRPAACWFSLGYGRVRSQPWQWSIKAVVTRPAIGPDILCDYSPDPTGKDVSPMTSVDLAPAFIIPSAAKPKLGVCIEHEFETCPVGVATQNNSNWAALSKIA